MNTAHKRSPLSSIPGYSKNAVLQLIIASGVGFISYHLIRVITVLGGAKMSFFGEHFTPNLALPPWQAFGSKVWTLATYGWTHNGFWELFSNMIWLYAFGVIVQTLIGYKQVIPLFVYALIMGGLFYELSQLIPGETFMARGYVIGAQAGIVALAVAALTLAPNYRFHLAPTFSIPIAVIAIIFFALMVMNSNLHGASLFLLLGGAVTGFTYVKLLQSGFKPGSWPYDIFARLDRMASPDEKQLREKNSRKRNSVLNKMQDRGFTQNRIDEILEKIHQKGYNALTNEEKEILMKASKDNES